MHQNLSIFFYLFFFLGGGTEKEKVTSSTEKKIDHIHTSSTVFPVISDGNFGAGDTAVLIVEVVLHDNQNKRIRQTPAVI